MPEQATTHVAPFYCCDASSFAYVVSEEKDGVCAVVDAVADFDLVTAKLSYQIADRMIDYIRQRQLRLEWILETQIHTSHLSAAAYIQSKLGGAIAVSAELGELLKPMMRFPTIYTSLGDAEAWFDRLLAPEDHFTLGQVPLRVHALPGHNPSGLAFQIGESVFPGAAMLMPDSGVARVDTPLGDAAKLYQSLSRLLTLPAETRMYIGRDFHRRCREMEYETSVGAQRDHNIALANVDRFTFIERHSPARSTLQVHPLHWLALQINLRAGRLVEGDLFDNTKHAVSLPVERVVS